jgi:hypothetical protein
MRSHCSRPSPPSKCWTIMAPPSLRQDLQSFFSFFFFLFYLHMTIRYPAALMQCVSDSFSWLSPFFILL